jgi:hypothetical protein
MSDGTVVAVMRAVDLTSARRKRRTRLGLAAATAVEVWSLYEPSGATDRSHLQNATPNAAAAEISRCRAMLK